MSKSLYDIVKCKDCVFKGLCCLHNPNDENYSCSGGERVPFLINAKPEAALVYEKNGYIYPVSHGTGIEMLKLACKIKTFSLQSGDKLKNFKVSVLPYEMTL